MRKQRASWSEEKKREMNKMRHLIRKKNKENLFKHRLECRLRMALSRSIRGGHKLRHGSTFAAMLNWLGCNVSELRFYISGQFQEGMTWENQGDWHIDHIIPLCQFNPESEEDMRKAWHYTNLRPLWATQNLRREKKGNVEHQPSLLGILGEHKCQT